MPKYVQVNDGLVEVPDSWTPQQIGSALKRAFPTAERKALMDEMAAARQGGTSTIAELPGAVADRITPDTIPIPTYGTERPTEESYERLGKVDREAIQSPMVELPRVDVPDQAGFWNAFGREMVNQGISLPEFFTSPQGVATVALGAVPGGSTAVGAYYGSEMLHGAITEAQDAYANWGEMTPAEKGVSVARIVGSGAMMGGIVRHGMKRPSQLPRISKEEGLAKDELTPEQGIRAMDAGDLPQIPRKNVIETPSPMLPNAAQTVSVIDTITKEQVEALKPKEAPEPSPEKPVSPVVEKPAPSEPEKPSVPVQLALEEQRAAGWNPKWPFIPQDLGNASFRDAIASDPALDAATKKSIFDAGVKLGVITDKENPYAIESRKVEEGIQPERAGVPQGQDVPTDVAQVRQGEGEQASGGGGLRTAEEVQQGGAKAKQALTRKDRANLSKAIKLQDDIKSSSKDVYDAIARAAESSSNKELLDAASLYRESVKYDREEYGMRSGDPEIYGERLISIAERLIGITKKQNKQTEPRKQAYNKPNELLNNVISQKRDYPASLIDKVVGAKEFEEPILISSGYVREGDRYVYKPESAKAAEVAPTAPAPEAPRAAQKIESNKLDVRAGDKIRWEPNERERRYQKPVEGIVVDVISNTEGEVGYHILSQEKEDPGNVVRVWENRGKIVSRERKQVEKELSSVRATEKSSKAGTPTRPKTVVEIADEIAEEGVDPSSSYGLFVKARDLKPEIDASEWLPIYRQSLELAKLKKQIRVSSKYQPASAPVTPTQTGGSNPNAPAAEVPKGAEPAGMGGAVASEFEQSSTRGIGVKIAAIDQQRIARGEEPLAKLASRSFKGDVWPKTLAEIDVDPDAPSRLVEELRNKPRPLADADVAKLLYRQAELEYESANLSRQRAQAVEDAKRYPNRLEDVARIEGMEAVLNDQIDALERIAQPSKGETARGLASLRFMVKQNYTLAALEYRLRADSARDVGFLRGDALSEAERATLKEIAEGYKKTSEAYEKRVAEVEQKFAESEAARIAAEAEAEAARELPRFSKQIIEYAERKVSEMEKTSERYVKELLSSTWAPGPEQIYKMGYIAATKMARGITELAKLTDEMVALLGERVRPYMEQIKAKAEEILEQETAKEQPQVRERIKRAKASGDVEADVLWRVKSAVAKDEMDALHPLVYKLSRLYVERGARGWRAITDRVHSALKPLIPGLDYRDTLDMVAGVGRFKPASKNEITVALGDARREAQKVAKIQRVISKQPVPKFGIGRPEPKAHERWLEKVFNEMRKLHGVVVTDPATQAKSALAAMKRSVQNQIADLEYEIGRRQRIVRKRSDKPTDAELESLRARLAELREIEKTVFPKEPITDAQRLERAVKAAKAIDERLQKDIADAERGVFKEKRTPVTSQELESIRAHAAASRARLAELEELAGRRLTDAERALLSYKRRLAENTARYQDRIARGDFDVRKRKEPPLDEEALSLKAENEAWKNKFKELRVKEAYKRMAALKKLMHEFASFMINIKTVNSSIDVSAVGRQGGWLTSLHPWQAGKALGPMVRSMKNEKTALMYDQKLKQRKNYTNGKYQRSGLYLAPYASYVMSKMEETSMSTWARRIPGVGMSQRAYVTFLNELRANTFDLLESRFRRFMGEPSDANLKVLGNYINIVTGRGELAKFNNAAESMAVLFWSPRLMVSRFQTLLMQPVWTTRAGFKEALAMRSLVMAEYFQQIVTISAVALAAASAGADINTNPTSSDFLKINIGNGKTIDPFWGLQQPFVLLSRIRAKKMTTGAGKEVPVDRKAPWGAAKLDEILLRYARSKANPVWNILYNWWVEEDMFGAKYGNLEALRDIFVFLSWRDVLKLIADEGPIKGAALQALNLLGIPVQTKPSPEEQRLQNKMRRYEN